MSLLERVKYLANKQKISLKELALKLGMGESAIYKWDKSAPSTDNLKKVADYFGVSTDYLLGREKPQIVEDDKLKVIASHIDDDVTEDDMQEILNFIEFIKSKNK